MTEEHSHTGACFCGAVQFTVSGKPVAAGYCHCESCRHWSAGPVNAFTLWTSASLRVVAGADCISSYHKTPKSLRKWCGSCGGHLFTEHPGLGLIDVYAALLPTLKFEPALHVNYRESVLHLQDRLPRFEDMPKDMGGTGIHAT